MFPVRLAVPSIRHRCSPFGLGRLCAILSAQAVAVGACLWVIDAIL